MINPTNRRFVRNRRELLKYSALGGISTALRGTLGATGSPGDDRRPVVGTTAGKVCGYVANGVNIFKGIPYGATIEGERRFLPPRRSEGWDGIRPALDYGAMAIQKPLTDRTYARVLRGMYPSALYGMGSAQYGMSEDCLHLNLWSPQLGKAEKRPVMVWLHPGGFNSFAGNSPCTDGGNLARRHDVVVVSLNHRLGVFGYLYLGDLAGAKYAESGNAGMLDIVAALKWVQENIAQFGGDPGNVTIFGESGGAAKVSVLMAMPPAKGLFHKAIVQSGSRSRGAIREEAAATAKEVLARLKLDATTFDQLPHVPSARLLAAMGEDVYRPVVASDALPRHPFEPDAPSISADVPMLIGTTADEGAYFTFSVPAPENEAQLQGALVKALWGYGVVDDTEAALLIRMYRSVHPAASPSRCFIGIATGVTLDDAIIQAERKALQASAAVYMYQFAWQSPAFGAKYGSCHTFELPFVFDNIDAMPQLYGDAPDPRRYELASKISRAWVAFAHSGNPSHSGLPDWKPYTTRERATMVLNYKCELAMDLHQQERVAFEKTRPSRLLKVTTRKPL